VTRLREAEETLLYAVAARPIGIGSGSARLMGTSARDRRSAVPRARMEQQPSERPRPTEWNEPKSLRAYQPAASLTADGCSPGQLSGQDQYEACCAATGRVFVESGRQG